MFLAKALSSSSPPFNLERHLPWFNASIRQRPTPTRLSQLGASVLQHREDDGTRRGNSREVAFDGHPDNLQAVWDTGLLEQIDENEENLAEVRVIRRCC